jgi:hypothetical protein
VSEERRRERGAKTLQPEETRTETGPAADQDERDGDSRSEPPTPPIDEDIAGSVNAAVPDTED